MTSIRLRRPAMTRGEVRLSAASAVALVLLTADVVVGGYLTHLDDQIRDAIQPRADSAPWWWTAVAELGDLRIAVPVVAVLGIVCAQACWRWWPVIVAWATFALAEALILVLKLVVGRPGPGEWADRDGYPGYFPSGHSTTATVTVALVVFVVAETTAGRQRVIDHARLARRALGAGLVTGALTGSRAVLADTHWATDAAGGLLVACAVVVPALAIGRALVERPVRQPPA